MRTPSRLHSVITNAVHALSATLSIPEVASSTNSTWPPKGGKEGNGAETTDGRNPNMA